MKNKIIVITGGATGIVSKGAPTPKMPADKFARIFLQKLKNGENVMNIGQSASLEKFSRFMPKTAFKMLNKERN